MDNNLPAYKKLLEFIEYEISGITFEVQSPNLKVSSTLYAITIDHAQGIRCLLEEQAYPSAFALLRVIFESYIRAVWIEKCATEWQVEKFIKSDKLYHQGRKEIKFHDLVIDVDKALNSEGYFQQVKKGIWRGLNSLTHSGMQQTNYCFNGSSITHRYQILHVNEAIEFSTMLVSMAFSSLIDLSGKDKAESAINEIGQLAKVLMLNQNS